MKNTIKALTLHGQKREIEKNKFRIRVAGYCLTVYEDKILLVNTKSTGKWFLPGGEVSQGEEIEEAMKREVFEETGIEIEVEKFLTFREVFFYYDPLNEAYQNYALYFKCKPKSLAVTDKNNVADDESDKPTWVEMKKSKNKIFKKVCTKFFNFYKVAALTSSNSAYAGVFLKEEVLPVKMFSFKIESVPFFSIARSCSATAPPSF